jgi:hypothetical protein
MRGWYEETQRIVADLFVSCMQAGVSQRKELDGDQRPAEGVDGEVDASVGPGTNGERVEIQR